MSNIRNLLTHKQGFVIKGYNFEWKQKNNGAFFTFGGIKKLLNSFCAAQFFGFRKAVFRQFFFALQTLVFSLTMLLLNFNQALCFFSSETVSFHLPFALRLLNTRLPFGVSIRVRKPCLFLLFLFEGWYVLFMTLLYLYQFDNVIWVANLQIIFYFKNFLPKTFTHFFLSKTLLQQKHFFCKSCKTAILHRLFIFVHLIVLFPYILFYFIFSIKL